jgi:nucleoside-diphosphate-sugar epimerase
MKILITGAMGFVGSRVWPHLLAAGHQLVAVTRRKPDLIPEGLSIIEADLLIPGEPRRVAAAARADMLIHLAWSVEHGKFWTDPANLDWVSASLALSRAAVDAGARRIVATGTCFEYDWPAEGDCREEVTPLAGHTLYDISKNSLRSVLQHWCNQEGISFAWGRIFYLYGPNEHPARLVADIARALTAGQPAKCSTGAVRRDFMDVRDGGAAIAALALSDVTGPVNIGTGQAPSVAEIARALGEIAGRPDLVHIGARPDRPGEPPRIVADMTRLTREVGFTPSILLRTGLNDAFNWWRENG